MPCAIGHAAGHINHILKASAKDLAASVSVAQLLVERGSILEADSVVLVVAQTSYRDGLGLNLGEEPNELSRLALDGARVGVALVVVDDAQFESVPARMRAASAAMATVCASIFLCMVWGVCVCVCVCARARACLWF